MPKKSRICVVNAIYALLLYFLYSSEDQINETYFFFCTGIDKSIRRRFINNHYFLPWPKTKITRLVYHVSVSFYLRIIRKIRWPFLETTELFIEDSVPFSYYITGDKKYTLLETAPYCFRFETIPPKKFGNKIEWIVNMVNKLYHNNWGNNEFCKEIIITQNEILSYMKDKKITAVSLSSLWEKSSESKKALILNIFNLKKEDIEILRSRENILFTQCFVDDGVLTEEEHCRIYRKIVDNYDRNTLLIKRHPRETFDYKILFPDIPVFERPIPMQLLDLLGVRFKRAITVFSSAVASFNYEITIDWYGTEISDALLKRRGSKKCPPPLYIKQKK